MVVWVFHHHAVLPAAAVTKAISCCGLLWRAVLQALCAEASLAALRRVYPQIYASDVKLLIDPSAVHVTQQDFISAMKGKQITVVVYTASHRALLGAGKLVPALSLCVQPPSPDWWLSGGHGTAAVFVGIH